MEQEDWRDIDDSYKINSNGVVVYKPNGRIKSTCKGQVWLHDGEYHSVNSLLIKVGFSPLKTYKVTKYDLNGNKIKTYNSMTEATKDGYTMSGIVCCVTGRQLSHSGFIFRYENDEFAKYKLPPTNTKWKRNYSHTIEDSKRAALKYKTRKEFAQSEDKRYYVYARKHGWLDFVCSHMERGYGWSRRLIYAYEFVVNNERFVYVGLTYNIKQRDKQHHFEGAVFEFTQKNHIRTYSPKIIIENLTENESSTLEGVVLNQYISNGFIPINKAKTGGLGKTIKKDKKENNTRRTYKDYTTEELVNIIKIYKSRREANLHYPRVVSILCSRGVVIWEHNRQRNDWSKPIEVEYNNKVYVGFRNNVAKEISTLTSMGYKTIQNYINIAVSNGCVVHGLSCRYKK